jgi:hypothetical protein
VQEFLAGKKGKRVTKCSLLVLRGGSGICGRKGIKGVEKVEMAFLEEERKHGR